MHDTALLSELVPRSATRSPAARALVHGPDTLAYDELDRRIAQFASGLLALGLARADRVAIYLDKRFETVIACFGAAAAGGVFVPVNPLLKPEQVAYILSDCNVRVLVTSGERLALLAEALEQCPDLRHVVVVGAASAAVPKGLSPFPAGATCSTRRPAPATA